MAPHNQDGEDTTEPAPARSFPRFPELPAELRLMIWEHTRPRRILELTRDIAPGGVLADPNRRGIQVAKPLGVPAAAQSCFEARRALFAPTVGFHRVVPLLDRRPPLYMLPLTEEGEAAVPGSPRRLSWFDAARDLVLWTVRVPAAYEWSDEARALLRAPAVRRVVVPLSWAPVSAAPFGPAATRTAQVCSLATVFARLEVVSFVVLEMDIDVAAFGVDDVSRPGAKSCVLVDVHDDDDDGHAGKADRLFERLAPYPEAARYAGQWSRLRSLDERLLAMVEGTGIVLRSPSPDGHGETWGETVSRLASTWQAMTQGDDPPRPVPKFQEVMMLKMNGSFLEDVGFGDDIFEC
ncbi:hypothetical protein F4809DRAFT_655940 [Biscogniauxia mediterranea]|nr:hypothetical protein F4809DRAFT_655940 [Biscogniauxia mediterranea]